MGVPIFTALSIWKGEVAVPLSMRDIATQVAEAHKVGLKEILGDDRSRHIVWARQDAMRLCCELTNNSTTVIGKFFNRDHTTVIWGREQSRKRWPKTEELT